MKQSVLSVFFFLFIAVSFSQEEILSILPDPLNMPGLQEAGEPEVYQGDYLFDMINGGADVYFEYGFEQVVSQAYTGITGKSNVKVEIYQMTSKNAAFGIMSLNAMGKQINETKGIFSVTGKGYKMMHKSNYFIMISWANIPEDLEKDLINRISVDIGSKIIELANYPVLLTNTKTACPNTHRWLYFMGNIALRNATYLDFNIPFNYTEGVFYRCDVLDQIVFKPDDEALITQSTDLLIAAILGSNPEFTSLRQSSGVSIKEKDKLRFDIRIDGDAIVLIKYI